MIILNNVPFVPVFLLTMQRKFSREVSDPKNDTYKQFRDCIAKIFGDVEAINWEQILTEDSQYMTEQPVPSAGAHCEIADDEEYGDDIEQSRYG